MVFLLKIDKYKERGELLGQRFKLPITPGRESEIQLYVRYRAVTSIIVTGNFIFERAFKAIGYVSLLSVS